MKMKKPHLGHFWATNFFFENRASSLFSVYRGLPSCQKSKKSNDGKYENFVLQTEGLTDRPEGRTWLQRTRQPKGQGSSKEKT